jgi:hypothetical protein
MCFTQPVWPAEVVMRIKATVTREVVEWLRDHPRERRAFAEQLARVCADELSLLSHSVATVDPRHRFIQRRFVFGGPDGRNYVAVFEWKHADRSIRVHTCRRVDLPPSAPRAPNGPRAA